jgi:cell division protein FtsW
VFAAASALVLLTLWRIDYRWLASRPLRLPLAGAVPVPAMVLLLTAVGLGVTVLLPGVGHHVGEYARWLRVNLGGVEISIQPSEFIKIALVMFLAAWLTHPGTKPRSLWTFLVCMGVTGACVGVIITQDFGTAAVVGASAAITMILAGVPLYYLGAFIPPAAGAFWLLVVNVPYRMSRLDAMMDPWGTYHTKQSLIAILSGGWWGKGLGYGTIKQGFLPERSTDYIFSTLCEELGLVGGALLLLLLVVWMFQVRRASLRAPDRFGLALAGGLGFVVAMQSLLHIAVNLAAYVPPKGIGLPFVSAGGTSMLIMAAAVALIVSVTSRSRTDENPLQTGSTAEAIAAKPAESPAK